MQLVDEIGTVNNITRKYFSSKIMQKKEAGGLVPDLFVCFRKASYEVVIASGLQLSFNILR